MIISHKSEPEEEFTKQVEIEELHGGFMTEHQLDPKIAEDFLESLKKNDDYGLPGPQSIPSYSEMNSPGWALGSDQTFAEKLKDAYEQLKEAQLNASDLLLRIDSYMANFTPTNNPQEMTPSEEKLKTLIEQGFEKIEQSLTTIREANQKASPCVCSKVNLKSVKPTENEATQ